MMLKAIDFEDQVRLSFHGCYCLRLLMSKPRGLHSGHFATGWTSLE